VWNQICETDRKLGTFFLKGLFHWYPMNCSKKKGCATEAPMSVKGGLSIRHFKPWCKKGRRMFYLIDSISRSWSRSVFQVNPRVGISVSNCHHNMMIQNTPLSYKEYFDC
jgi:hypothetical protein